MTRLTDIITINISRETAAVAQTNFNVPLFISTHTNFKERARVYSSLLDVADDFGTTETAYQAAQAFFSQALVPTEIVIGRRQVPSATINVQSVTAGRTYTMTINDLPFSFVATGSADAIDVATGLKATYEVTPIAGITIVDHLDGTLTVTSNGVDWSIKVGTGLSKANSPATETWVDALNAASNANQDWYAVAIESHAQADVLSVAAAVEASKKIFGTSSSAVDIKTTATTDLFSALQAAGYQRTFGIWSATADTQFPECAWMGYQLQEQPGSNTWAYKSLANVTVSTLSPSEASAIKLKNGSTYEKVAGDNVTIGAKMFGGEWIDVMVFVDWLEARMTERLWFRMKNSKKIPYTAAGATIIESEIRAQLNDGIRAGGLAASPAPTVSIPDVLAVSPNLRAQRIFEGITFEARLAGAIHFVRIRGTVTV